MRGSVIGLFLLVMWASTSFAQNVTVAHNVNLRPEQSTAVKAIRLLTPSEPPMTLVEPSVQDGYYHVRTSMGEEGYVYSRNVHVSAGTTPTGGTTPTNVTVTHNVNLRPEQSTAVKAIRLLTPSEPPMTLIEPSVQDGYYHVRTSMGEEGYVYGRNVHVLFDLHATENAQTLTVTRPDKVYHPNTVLDPATLLSGDNFIQTESGRYVVAEGYIDYYATTWPEPDGDYHFEMQTTDKQHTLNPKDGLVCEIDPVLRLEGAEALKQIDQHKPSTYRKVRVYGFLRFGTESNHAGCQKYKLPNGELVSGHWEIHPVEKVESIDDRIAFKIGPSAKYVDPPNGGRYGLDDTDFPKRTVSNYAVLRGNVKGITRSTDESGDFEVRLEVNSEVYTATIPQYYVAGFDEATQTISFVNLPNFKAINYSLAPSDEKAQTFYGLRNWQFRQGEPIPTLAPVEIIK